jgi:Carbohydrate binding domain (family 25).
MNKIFYIISLITFTWAQSVYWEPELPVPGGEITIFYNVIDGTLDNNTNPVYAHVGFNGWEEVDDYPMTLEPSLGPGWWSYTYSISSDAETIDFVFTDL